MPGELEHSKRHRDVSTEQTWIRRWHRGAGTLIGGSEVTGLRVLRGGSRSSRSRNLELMRQASRSQGQEKGLCRRCGVLPSALPLRKSAFCLRTSPKDALCMKSARASRAFPRSVRLWHNCEQRHSFERDLQNRPEDTPSGLAFVVGVRRFELLTPSVSVRDYAESVSF